MATQLQIRRGTTAQMGAFTGAEGELAVNTSTDTVHVHDGATAGGFALAKADGSNIGTYAGSFTTLAASGAVTLSSTLAVTGEITANGGIALGDSDKATFGASDNLQIYHDGNHSYVRDEGAGGLILTTNGPAVYIQKGDTETSAEFNIDGAVKLRYDNSQKFATTSTGIDVTGTATMDGLTVVGADTALAASIGSAGQRVYITPNGTEIIYNASGNSAGQHVWQSGNTERMRIDQNGWVNVNANIATDNPADSAGLHFGWNYSNAEGESLIVFNKGGGSFGGLLFSDNSANGTPVERMRIDGPSGNLLVGTTSDFASGTVDGIIAQGTNKPAAAFSNTASGQIVKFYEGGSLIGSIGSQAGSILQLISQGTELYVGTSGNAESFFDAPGGVAFSTFTSFDGLTDLGRSNARFDDIYATNGTIQTSDKNEKQDIEALSDAEQRVAVACKGLLRKFRWKDSVAEKGDEARTHFGIIAQDLQAAFAAEGLDAGDYAMFINSTWTDEETGEERSRMGVRYSELLAFIIAAI